ncbi:MAG: glycosyl hydrolase family 5 [Cytophagaceae bacterium]|nr:glycosyl hydrolase family 5 [Cytophagaceae bacterium]
MKSNKTLYRIFIILGFLGINAAVLFGISQVMAYLNTGADRAKMLHLDSNEKRPYIPETIWTSLDNPGRPIEKANLTKIERDYLDAWQAKNDAFFTGDTRGIFDHYTTKARAKIEALITANSDTKTFIETTTHRHHLALEFYSADGTLVVLTDKNVWGTQRFYQSENLISQQDFNDDYKVILLLEDGFWRVRHIEKIATHPIPVSATVDVARLAQMQGVNYYPQHSPWDTFGPSFDTDTLDRDFKIIKDLRLNTIRVFIGYKDFGKAYVPQKKLERLQLLLNQAHSNNLGVVVTLFDFYGDYSMQDWTHTNAHLKQIVTAVKEHPALVGWDIKNEPDLDFDSRTKSNVLSWLQQSIRYLKSIDNTHFVTIGWSNPTAALLLEDQVDLVSYHYYKELQDLATVHQRLSKATTKPVFLQEFGLSSYHGFWNMFGPDQEDQAAYYQKFVEIQKRDSLHYLFWTLYDFENIPQNVAGDLPWRKNKQAYFGIINKSGVKDKAYTILKNRLD